MMQNGFRHLLIGQTCSGIGGAFLIMALMPMLFEKTGSAAAMALVPFLLTGLRFIGTVLAPILMVSMPLRSMIVGAESLKAVTLLIVIFVGLLVDAQIFLLVLYGCTALIGLLNGCASPAYRGLLPRLVKEKELMRANSLLASVSEMIEMAAWPLGGMAIVMFGTSPLLYVTGILFACGALVMLFVTPTKVENQRLRGRQNVREEVSRGWLYIWHRPVLRRLTGAEGLESAANVVWIAAIMYVYVSEALGASEVWWGYMNASMLVGLFLAGLYAYGKTELLQEQSRFFILGSSILIALATGVLAINSSSILALVLIFLFGIGSQLKGVLVATFIQKRVPEKELPNVYAAQEAFGLSVFGCSALIFGVLIDLLNVRFIFGIAAILMLSATILMFTILHYFAKTDSKKDMSL